MWSQTASKWLQDRAKEAIKKADEVRQTRLVTDLETTGMSLIHNLVSSVGGGGGMDEEALRLVRLQYITERMVAMGFPEAVDTVAMVLNNRHPGHFMIWNISEEAYDYTKFDNQVLEFKFPGHPAPPLGLLIKMCTSIENWLQADRENVAVVHCLTGKGRTATVLAAVLCWIGWDVGQPSGQNPTTLQALQFVSEKMGLDVNKMTIPSQRRYLQYFNNMVEGVKPRSEPLLLRRVILNSIPKFGAPPDSGVDGSEAGAQEEDPLMGCCPYLQLFKGGKLICTVPCSRNGSTGSESKLSADGVTMLPWAFPSDGSIIFAVDCVIQGDILIRARHLSPNGQKISMFRAAFHTGYVPCGVLRLSKAQLDGACSDDRFEQDFFIDLIFAPVEEAVQPSASEPQLGVASDPEDKDNYDAMMHRDTRFWSEIAARKRRAAARARQGQGVTPRSSAAGGGGSTTTPRFSITGDGDEAAVAVDEDAGLIEFDASPVEPEPAATPVSQPPAPSASAGILSDDDLLQELQAVELKLTPKDPTAQLNALEELEKELGFDISSSTPHQQEQHTSTGSAELDLSGLDEDLGEYEGFLQSLSKT